ncbi:MAG: exonuclease domain-containing protein [Planctomycetaceae bacterium]|nr:exonuclease domain-containing protein [Planctomycetaceae bacterium]
MASRPHHYLVVDFEATCANDGSLHREEMEIIEVGAVMVDGESLELLSEFQAFVRPVRHPVLTDFCTELTSITQANVDRAPTFPEVVDRWKAWADAYGECVFSSWGQYDYDQLSQDCRYHRLAVPFMNEPINLKAEFSIRLNQRRRMGMKEALSRAGLTLEGTHHRGIDDARNIARLLPFIVGDAEIPQNVDVKRRRK